MKKTAQSLQRIHTRETGLLYIDHISYQRNGCSGDGFHTVQFRQRNIGQRGFRPMVATLSVADDPNDQTADCRVLCLDDLTDAWRGEDCYGAPLRDLIRKTDSKIIHSY